MIVLSPVEMDRNMIYLEAETVNNDLSKEDVLSVLRTKESFDALFVPRAFTRSRADFKQMVLACDFAPTLWKHPLVRTLFGLDGRRRWQRSAEALGLRGRRRRGRRARRQRDRHAKE